MEGLRCHAAVAECQLGAPTVPVSSLIENTNWLYTDAGNQDARDYILYDGADW